MMFELFKKVYSQLFDVNILLLSIFSCGILIIMIQLCRKLNIIKNIDIIEKIYNEDKKEDKGKKTILIYLTNSFENAIAIITILFVLFYYIVNGCDGFVKTKLFSNSGLMIIIAIIINILVFYLIFYIIRNLFLKHKSIMLNSIGSKGVAKNVQKKK